mgnify:CR=1 FL=1
MLMALMLGLLTVPGEENSSLAKKNGYVINLDRAEKLEKMTYSSLSARRESLYWKIRMNHY